MKTIRSRMTPLRQRMFEDLQLRNYSEHTTRAYLRCVADFAKHFGTSPEHLGPEQVRTYQLFLVQEKQVGPVRTTLSPAERYRCIALCINSF